MSKYLIVAILVLLSITGGVFTLYLGERDERIKAEINLESTKLTLETTITNFNNQVTLNNGLNIDVAKITFEKDVAISELNGYRSRENVIKKKPKLVERLANAATKRMFNDLCTSSGGNCKDKTAKSKSNNSTSN